MDCVTSLHPAGVGQWEAALELGGRMEHGPRMFILQGPFPLQGSGLALLVIDVSQSCLTLCDPMDHSPQGSSVHGILQARILEWVAISSSRGPFCSGLNPRVLCLLHWQVILYCCATYGSVHLTNVTAPSRVPAAPPSLHLEVTTPCPSLQALKATAPH